MIRGNSDFSELRIESGKLKVADDVSTLSTLNFQLSTYYRIP